MPIHTPSHCELPRNFEAEKQSLTYHVDRLPCWQTGHPMPTRAPPTQDS